LDNVVVITANSPRECDVVGTLRQGGWRVITKRPEDDPDEVILDRPHVVVVVVPEAANAQNALRPVINAPGMESIPVIAVIGARGLQQIASVHALTDFVIRPIRPEELTARVRRPIARHVRDDDDRIVIDTLIIDIKGYEVSINDVTVDLTYQEFELLKFLASHPDQAFSRDQLLARVWGYDYYGGSRTVDIHVRRIRAKLMEYAKCIRTIRHVGYKWSPAQTG